MQSRLDYLDSMMNTQEIHSRENTIKNKDNKKLYQIYGNTNHRKENQNRYPIGNNPRNKKPRNVLPNSNYQRINSNKPIIKPSSIDNDSIKKDNQNVSFIKTEEVNIDLSSIVKLHSPGKQKVFILNKDSTAKYLSNKAKI